MNVLDLFSGIGGFSLGLERAGMKTVAFCEIDKKARQVLKKHWPDVPIFEDVKSLTKEKLDEQTISVDVICGGFPCQDISLAGRGEGLAGERSGLWFQFHRLIKEIRPQWVIIENVSALRSRGLDQVLWSLSQIGYDAEWHCIPASAIGAPHRRDRIWIVAHPRYGSGGNVWSAQEGSEHESQRTANPSEIGGSSQQSEIVAYATSKGLSERGRSEGQTGATKTGTGMVPEPQRCCKNVADSSGEGLQRHEWRGQTGTQRISKRHFAQCGGWPAEPDVGRVAHGVPGRVDRLKQLGNAVVPQIPELIGRAIMEIQEGE